LSGGDESGVGLSHTANGVGVATRGSDNLVGPTATVGKLGDATGGGFALDGHAHKDDVADLK